MSLGGLSIAPVAKDRLVSLLGTCWPGSHSSGCAESPQDVPMRVISGGFRTIITTGFLGQEQERGVLVC